MDYKDREDQLMEAAKELIEVANELIIISDSREKIEFMSEVFQEALLGTLKCYVLMNPTTDATHLIDEITREMEAYLLPFDGVSENLVN